LSQLRIDQFIAEIVGQKEERKDPDVSKRQAAKASHQYFGGGFFGPVSFDKIKQ